MATTLRNNLNTVIVAKPTGTSVFQSKPSTPLTIRNNVQTQVSVGELADLVEGTPEDGSAIVYNSTLDKYEVKPITASGIASVDGGEF